VARAGVKSEHMLGPMETNTKQAQGLFVILPKKEVVTNIGAPYAVKSAISCKMGNVDTLWRT
jgi:immune inhibitor A